MRTIAAVTVGRSDYGILRPVLRAVANTPDVRLQVIVGGTHWSPPFGSTVAEIEPDGFDVTARVDTVPRSDTPLEVARAMAAGVSGFSDVYARCLPDIVLLVGDRFETLAAASAAVPFTIPIAHIHGGELTEGAIDEQIRHAITKLSHLHFVAAEPFARRLERMGEAPWRITVSGAPALDNLSTLPRLDRETLSRQLGVSLEPPLVLVTFHPETLRAEGADQQVAELVSGLEAVDATFVLTAPNADAGHEPIFSRLRRFAKERPRAAFVSSLGTQAYFSLMAHGDAMVGNSSSGIIEAPSFGLPVVNIGERQAGRMRAANVIDVGSTRDEVLTGIRRALSPEFRTSLSGMSNPYGDGHAGPRVAARLATVAVGRELLVKRFHESAA